MILRVVPPAHILLKILKKIRDCRLSPKIQRSRLVAQQSHAVAGGTPCYAGPAQLGSLMGKAAQAPCATQASSLGASGPFSSRSEDFLGKLRGKQGVVKACESRKRWKSRR